jgi:hypothetical protein
VQPPDLNTLDPVSLKYFRKAYPRTRSGSGEKIGVFFADTFGAYAKVLSLQTITILALRGKG